MFTMNRMNTLFEKQSLFSKDGLGILPANVLVGNAGDQGQWPIARVLRSEGYDVVETENGIDLITNLKFPFLGEAWDLIISDAYLPLVTGLEVLEALRESHWMTPFILITDCGDRISRAKAHRLGATTVIDRPVHLDDLRRLVKRLISP